MKTNLVALYLAISVAATLGAAESEPVILRQWGGNDIADYFRLHREEADKLPKWNPETSTTPPILMSEVIEDALPLIRDFAKGWPWRIKTIALVNGQSDETEGIWYYDVNATIDTRTKSNRKPVSFRLLKLMDGTILCPEIKVPEHIGPPVPDPVVQPEEGFTNATKIVLNRIGLKSGENYVYEISKEVALGLPDWYAESGRTIPLETRDILAEVHKLVQEQIPDQEWDLQSFRLMCGGKGGGKRSEARHISYYSIALLHQPKESKQEKKYWNILVLLDGSAIFPNPLKFSE